MRQKVTYLLNSQREDESENIFKNTEKGKSKFK